MAGLPRCIATGCSSPPRVEVPCEIFPPDTGLIVADAFGARFSCEAPEHRLPAATRKSMMLLFARAAALRLQSLDRSDRTLWDRSRL